MIENLNIGKVSAKLNKIASGTAVLNMKSIPTKITFHQGIIYSMKILREDENIWISKDS